MPLIVILGWVGIRCFWCEAQKFGRAKEEWFGWLKSSNPGWRRREEPPCQVPPALWWHCPSLLQPDAPFMARSWFTGYWPETKQWWDGIFKVATCHHPTKSCMGCIVVMYRGEDSRNSFPLGGTFPWHITTRHPLSRGKECLPMTASPEDAPMTGAATLPCHP